MTRTLQHQLAERNAAALGTDHGFRRHDGRRRHADRALWKALKPARASDRPDAAASSSRGDAFARAGRRRLRRAARLGRRRATTRRRRAAAIAACCASVTCGATAATRSAPRPGTIRARCAEPGRRSGERSRAVGTGQWSARDRGLPLLARISRGAAVQAGGAQLSRP